jgi:putative oxidoreductase
MKNASTIARYLLGFVFVVFGLNGFLHFIPMPAPTGLAGQYMGALYVSHYLSLIFLLQLVPGVMLLANRFVPLALTLLGPVVVNIFCYHAFMDNSGLPLALIIVVLWGLTFFGVRFAFAGLFRARVTQEKQTPSLA